MKTVKLIVSHSIFILAACLLITGCSVHNELNKNNTSHQRSTEEPITSPTGTSNPITQYRNYIGTWQSDLSDNADILTISEEDDYTFKIHIFFYKTGEFNGIAKIENNKIKFSGNTEPDEGQLKGILEFIDNMVIFEIEESTSDIFRVGFREKFDHKVD